MADHHKKTSLRMEVFFVEFQMLGQMIDPIGQKRNLHLGGTGVTREETILFNNLLFCLFVHDFSPFFSCQILSKRWVKRADGILSPQAEKKVRR